MNDQKDLLTTHLKNVSGTLQVVERKGRFLRTLEISRLVIGVSEGGAQMLKPIV